jgi:hypothetical protein
MSLDKAASVDAPADFREKLHRLRIKIDSLPESQRPHLIELADTIARQHRQLEAKMADGPHARVRNASSAPEWSSAES